MSLTSKLVTPSGNKINLYQDIRTYLEENGLFPSKKIFILRTNPLFSTDFEGSSDSGHNDQEKHLKCKLGEDIPVATLYTHV